ncbi:hypothetical protein [Mycobacterium sp. 1423905.2]|uniref:PPW family C-terminal domain-containing PPE protein n=1 Tax=Mycobacterium sp. 1423905.2 TaxID=1856859 RepID=UPI000801D5B7|nr:hypothetical protein [Mycobacterium sp. 1423905.2]OBJ48133.1 hypothetical protein A9W95_05270 [Mycobacterium sp. 1423905.2]
MIFGPDGQQIPGQGQPNWNPLEYVQNISNFLNGNTQALTYLQTNIPQALTNPAQLPALLSYFVAWQTFRAVNWTLRTLRFLLQTAPLLVPAMMNLAVAYLGGLVGLSGLAGLAPTVAPPMPAAPVPIAEKPDLPSPILAAPVLTPTPTPTPTPATAPIIPAPATPAAPMPAPGVETLGYLVGGPGPDLGPTLRTGLRARQPARDSAPVGAAATTAARREHRRAAQRRMVIDRGYRYEYLDDGEASGAADHYPASESGSTAMGFAGTLAGTPVRPAGLTNIAGDGFGGGPTLPLLPGAAEE